nr:MAG TPA: Terminase large subunit [Caudoviricetes sp.]
MDRTTQYAKDVVAGKIIAGKSVIQACQRHLDDLKRSRTKDYAYRFDTKAAERALDIANTLTILEGDAPVRLQTRGFQDFIIGSLEGWKQKGTGYRRFRESYVQIARQNGKTFLNGILGVIFSGFHPYKQGRIICAATKQEQANLVWDEIRKFIVADEDLNALYKVTRSKYEITSKVTGTVIRSVGRDTKSMDGFRSILAIPDELHAHKDDQTYRLLLGGQRRVNDALISAITTAGFDLNGFCYEHYQYCKKVLSGVVTKDSMFVYIAEMDEDDDIWDYHNWIKANPLLLLNPDNSINMQEIVKMSETASEAQVKGGKTLMDFLTKWLNRWVTYKEDMLVDVERFKACACDLTLEDMRGRACYLGIDLSSGGDLTSIALLFPLDDGRAFVHSHSFMPELRLLEHEQTDGAPYRLWVNNGLITLTTGAFGIKTDYKFIVKYLEDIIEQYDLDITACGYDAHNASAFLPDLDFLGCDLIEVKQSAQALNDATVDYQLTVKAGQLLYNRHDELYAWSALSASLVRLANGDCKIDKTSTANRIDPIDATIDAWDLWFRQRGDNYNVNAEVDDFLALAEKLKGGARI